MAVDTAIRIAPLRPSLLSSFLEFADRSTLRSLAPVRASRRVAADQMFVCALLAGRVVGCTSYRPRHWRSYVGLDGRTAGSACVYLCSSEVMDGFRGLGIGSALYARRLAACRRLGATTAVVEILGTGTPFSVDAPARRGLDWHLAQGFRLAGHSREDDSGPVLLCRLDRALTAATRADRPTDPQPGPPGPRGPAH